MGNIEFGQFIARRRTEIDMKPEELARRLGRKSKSVVYDLESGRQDPTVQDLNILARELGTSVEALLLQLGARINPPEAAMIAHDVVENLLALRGDYFEAARKAVRGLRRDQDDPGGRR